MCHQLGLYGGTILQPGQFPVGDGPVWLDGISCRGDEDMVLYCDNTRLARNNCTHAQDLGLMCDTVPNVEGKKQKYGCPSIFKTIQLGP